MDKNVKKVGIVKLYKKWKHQRCSVKIKVSRLSLHNQSYDCTIEYPIRSKRSKHLRSLCIVKCKDILFFACWHFSHLGRIQVFWSALNMGNFKRTPLLIAVYN